MPRCQSSGIERIAQDWDTHSSAVTFSSIEQPWFGGYKGGGYIVEWQGQDELVLASDRATRIKIGLPSMRITFPVLYGEEIQILRELEGKVSIYALDQDTYTWGKYNAVMLLPDLAGTEMKFEKKDYVVSFIDLLPVI
jgi:hypothetical protein